MQEKRHLWTGVAFSDGKQVRIEPTGRSHPHLQDFDRYLSYLIRYRSGRTLPLTQMQFVSRIGLPPALQLAQHAIDLGGAIETHGSPHTLSARDIRDARDLPAPAEIIGVTLSGNQQIADEDLVQLETLNFLEAIDLSHTRVTQTGLSGLSELPKLKQLNLSGSAISDGAASQIPAWLEHLDVSQTQIGDLFLVELERCKSLKRVVLSATQVTPEGTDSLRRALPGCEIINTVDPGHPDP